VHRIVAVFSFIVATMWIVIVIAEIANDGPASVIVTSTALAAAFGFAGYRLLRNPPARFR
jgi:small-conductance mechanosensitive channel